jgi:4-amino-4-deoxy-L-arabinose transferase-like glycosyltransferase
MSSHVSSTPRETESKAAPLSLFFPCSRCGKNLKSRAELAGKKVKCPHCGQITLAPQNGPNAPPPAPLWRILLPPRVLGLILWTTFVLKLYNLDHTALTRWDEVFHAAVAQNVLKHPLKPTLIDVPYLPYDQTKWGENHVWLHKPILPFWQIALSFAVLGVSTFALRLPSVILSTGAALLTYLIGKELFDRRTALIAATLQAMNPFLLTLIHGYQFADQIDVALLFWVEAGMYFLTRSLRTGSWRDVLLAGAAQGLAFLCKSYLAGIIFGVALTAWLLPLCRMGNQEHCRIGSVRLVGMLAVTLLTIAPWLTYCMTNYPQEFWHEHAQVWKHLNSNVENWAAPWDRVAFDYLIAIYGVFYTPILVAAVVLVGKAVGRRHTGLWLMYGWGLGVLLPHLFAVSKTPSATVIGMPALLLLLGYLVAEAWRGERWPLTALTAILFLSVVMPAVIKNPGYSYPSSRGFGGVMRQSLWVLYHVAGALALAAAVAIGWVLLRRRLAAVGRYVQAAALLFCVCGLIWLGVRTVSAAWGVTSRDVNDPHSVEVGQFARDHLPDNAVLLCEERKGYEHLTIMFYADRTCYALESRAPDEMARRVVQAGGIPYVVSYRRWVLQPVHISVKKGPTVYRWQQLPP